MTAPGRMPALRSPASRHRCDGFCSTQSHYTDCYSQTQSLTQAPSLTVNTTEV